MIDDRIPLSDAAELFPKRNGKPPQWATLRRWNAKGIRGVKLAMFRVGGRWYTTRQAVVDFIQECNPELGTEPQLPLLRPDPQQGMSPVMRKLTARGYCGAKAKEELLGVPKRR